MIATKESDNQAASTSSSPVYQQLTSSHVPKRKISSTNKRKTKRRFAETPRDVSEGPEFCMEDAEGARVVQEQPEGPQPQGRAGRDRRRLQLWQWNRIYPRGPYTPRNIPFTGNEGIQQSLPPNPTAEDFFKLYINEDIIDHIVTQTNLYAQQYIEREQNNLRPHSLVNAMETNRQARNDCLSSSAYRDGNYTQTKDQHVLVQR